MRLKLLEPQACPHLVVHHKSQKKPANLSPTLFLWRCDYLSLDSLDVLLSKSSRSQLNLGSLEFEPWVFPGEYSTCCSLCYEGMVWPACPYSLRDPAFPLTHPSSWWWEVWVNPDFKGQALLPWSRIVCSWDPFRIPTLWSHISSSWLVIRNTHYPRVPSFQAPPLRGILPCLGSCNFPSVADILWPDSLWDSLLGPVPRLHDLLTLGFPKARLMSPVTEHLRLKTKTIKGIHTTVKLKANSK